MKKATGLFAVLLAVGGAVSAGAVQVSNAEPVTNEVRTAGGVAGQPDTMPPSDDVDRLIVETAEQIRAKVTAPLLHPVDLAAVPTVLDVLSSQPVVGFAFQNGNTVGEFYLGSSYSVERFASDYEANFGGSPAITGVAAGLLAVDAIQQQPLPNKLRHGRVNPGALHGSTGGRVPPAAGR